MKVVCGYDPGKLYEVLFAGWANNGARVVVSPEEDDSRLASELRDADVLLHILKPVTDEVLAGAPRLRLVQKIGVGVNTIDLEAAHRRGIAVMLAALRNLTGFDRACRVGKGWAPEGETRERRNALGELCGRTVGLVGAGAVASRLVGPLRALGARVIYTARSERSDLGIERYNLDDLLEASDVVSLHLPLTPETEKLIDRVALARMKPGAVLVNTARGGLVEEAALVEALTSGHLRAAGLDVLSEEPPQPDHSLLSLENVVVTPHVAWLTQETLARSFDIALENICRLRDGRDLLFRVA